MSSNLPNAPSPADAETDLFNDNSAAKAQQGGTGTVIEQQTVAVKYEAPLPPPQHLQFYETVLPGAADRIIVMAESAQKNQSRYNLVVLLLSFIIIIAVLGLAAFLLITGQHWVGLVVLVGELGLLITSFKSRKR